ncbi:MAG: hypothetical protein KDA89_05800 [Planctomycetaceae bacterium]|nr:hypothetical protein [Planctomycetaceae bacterium]
MRDSGIFSDISSVSVVRAVAMRQKSVLQNAGTPAKIGGIRSVQVRKPAPDHDLSQHRSSAEVLVIQL